MALHLVKLAVGAESVEGLAAWQKTRSTLAHVTRMMPARREELLAGGSLYWVIKGEIRVRQNLLDIEAITDKDGTKRCRLLLDRTLVPVAPRPRRPFQGWRYLQASEAPPDLGIRGGSDLPEALRAELVSLGLL